MRLPLKNPTPNKDRFKKIILRQEIPQYPPFMELHIDTEIVKEFVEKELGRKLIKPLPEDIGTKEAYLRNYIECWYRLGFDCIRLTSDFRFKAGLHFTSKTRGSQDTAELARSERKWTEEGQGIISSWEDFEKYPWPSLDDVDNWAMDFISANLPE